jgi:hypothetical protein
LGGAYAVKRIKMKKILDTLKKNPVKGKIIKKIQK